MPTNLVKTERDERLWSEAKASAATQGHKEDWAYINGIYQKMKGHTKTAEASSNDSTAGIPIPILDAIKSVASDGWYGFKPDKNEYGTPLMRYFSPTIPEPGHVTPRPEKMVDALRSADWMSIPEDNINGHPNPDSEHYEESKEVFDKDYKTASLLHAISSLEVAKDVVDTNAPINIAEGNYKQAESEMAASKSYGIALRLLRALEKRAYIQDPSAGMDAMDPGMMGYQPEYPDMNTGEQPQFPMLDGIPGIGEEEYQQQFPYPMDYGQEEGFDMMQQASLVPKAKLSILESLQKTSGFGNPLAWGFGGLLAGIYGVPELQKELGVHADTQQLLEQGNPNFVPAQRILRNPYLERGDRIS